MTEGASPTINGTISVVMPAYNEAGHILDNLRETIKALIALDTRFEIILVDDGSQDATWAEVAGGSLIEVRRNDEGRHNEALYAPTIDSQPTIRILQYHNRRGKGHALGCGSLAARGDYIVFLDADCELHPYQLSNFFRILDEKNADVVIGSKLHPESEVNYPWQRRVMSYCYYLLVRTLFGLPVRDTQTGLKVFRAEVLRAVVPRVSAAGFAFDVAVLTVAHLLGFKISEAPIKLDFRRRYNRINIATIAMVAKETLAIFYEQRILRLYARPPTSRQLYQPQVEMSLRPRDEILAR